MVKQAQKDVKDKSKTKKQTEKDMKRTNLLDKKNLTLSQKAQVEELDKKTGGRQRTRDILKEKTRTCIRDNFKNDLSDYQIYTKRVSDVFFYFYFYVFTKTFIPAFYVFYVMFYITFH